MWYNEDHTHAVVSYAWRISDKYTKFLLNYISHWTLFRKYSAVREMFFFTYVFVYVIFSITKATDNRQNYCPWSVKSSKKSITHKTKRPFELLGFVSLFLHVLYLNQPSNKKYFRQPSFSYMVYKVSSKIV